MRYWKYFLSFIWYSLSLLTAERTGCGTSLGVEWLGVPMIGINLDSGIGFLWGGDTADMPKSPVYKHMSESKYDQTESSQALLFLQGKSAKYFTV